MRNDYYHFEVFNADTDFFADFSEVAHLNPFPQVMNGASMSEVASTTSRISTAEIEKTEFFDQVCRSRGEVNRGSGIILHAEGTDVAFVAANIPKRYSADDEDRLNDTLETIRTHFQGAFKLLLNLNERRHAAPSANFWLEHIPTAALIVSGSGRVEIMNERAKKLAHSPNGFFLDPRNVLSSTSRKAGLLLDELICRVAHTRYSVGPYFLPRPDGKKFTAYASPTDDELTMPITLRRSRHEGNRILLKIFDPDDITPGNEEVIRHALGLSQREAAVVLRLVGGEGLKESAQSLGVSHHTVRNQLASANAKVGTNSQSEIVRMATQLLAKIPG